MKNLKVAILYQSEVPPAIDGIVKPMKEGGYSDSGADIALALIRNEVEVITPVNAPNSKNDLDWVFPDGEKGIERAISRGANVFWLNTVLYAKHAILEFKDRKLLLVGQVPESVQRFDDKFYTNNLLRENSFPVPRSALLNIDDKLKMKLKFPLVVKPIRGRGSQGVSAVYNMQELNYIRNKLITKKIYGTRVMVEEFLPGEEITLSIMPPGRYRFNDGNLDKKTHWAMPPVYRFNHINEIAPYNGVVAVVNNSRLLSQDKMQSKEIKRIVRSCEAASELIGAKAPIRIDCRQDKNGKYFIFDVNLKPNMTGASRPHRLNQDSLTMIAARGIGWSYPDLISNILMQYWKM
jgi:hypothetical protein